MTLCIDLINVVLAHRKQWKIMVELDQQPMDDPDEETNNK